MILLLQFSCSQSVWWPYIQSVCWCYCRAGRVCTWAPFYGKPEGKILLSVCRIG